jgi:hypothetical protein
MLISSDKFKRTGPLVLPQTNNQFLFTRRFSIRMDGGHGSCTISSPLMIGLTLNNPEKKKIAWLSANQSALPACLPAMILYLQAR